MLFINYFDVLILKIIILYKFSSKKYIFLKKPKTFYRRRGALWLEK